ncbi:MAG: hypothetical protein GX936_09620 [Clostridiales bacterium]|nr:hypothetical protein [Clostridiales bacterium]
MEDLRLYPTRESQCYIESAVSVRAKSAKLLYVTIDVEEITFNRGYYTVSLRYFYMIKGEAFSLVNRPAEISGLAIFDKNVMLFGSEGSAKVFTSAVAVNDITSSTLASTNMPIGVVEAVDPIILGMKLVDVSDHHHRGDNCVYEIPNFISECFPCELLFDRADRRVLVTLGQFSIVKLERNTQLLIPSYDYCLPDKECIGAGEDDPCKLFSRIHFPVDEFFPPDTLEYPEGYRETKASAN